MKRTITPSQTLMIAAARSGVGRDGFERLAWAASFDELPAREGRRESFWRLGAGGATQGPDGQLPLSLEAPAAPPLDSFGRWERIVEDYRSTGVNLG